jgi:hypothetical protein
LGFLLPIGGFLIWVMQKETYPQRSESALKGAIWGLFANSFLGAVGYYSYVGF